MFCTITNTTISKSKTLSEEEYQKKEEQFHDLYAKLKPFIKNQAISKSVGGTNGSIDTDDYESIGLVQIWAAVLDYDDTKKISIESWAKRRIWSNMIVLATNSQKRKRVPYDEDIRYRPISFSQNDYNLLDYIEDKTIDPLTSMEDSELYDNVYKKLLSMKHRVACAILRLLTNPDSELLSLCKSKKLVITNKILALRLSCTDTAIAVAKKQIVSLMDIFNKKVEMELKCISCLDKKTCIKYNTCIKCLEKKTCIKEEYNTCIKEVEWERCVI
jgi:hypothetical protein